MNDDQVSTSDVDEVVEQQEEVPAPTDPVSSASVSPQSGNATQADPSKLYVGNLSYNVTDQDLAELFNQAGQVVSATVIKDKFSGRSKGFGFVVMSTPEAAQKAVEMLNGTTHMDRPLVVNIARPLEERPPRRDFNRDDRPRRY